jgi:hypothetical protein
MIVGAALTLPAMPALAADDDWVLSPTTGAFNVVRDSGVDNTGHTDVTVKLNNIIGNAMGYRWVYLPKGTYLVSGQISGMSCDYSTTTTTHGPVIVGESRTGTVIRLKDGTWPTPEFNPPQFPNGIWHQVVLHGGDCGNTAFGKEMHNFTVDIGSNNAGAIGLNFSTANAGGISNINVISRDGHGNIGVSLWGGEIGPAYAHSIYVKGFKVGIYACAWDDITLFQIKLENQTQYGVYNAATCSIDSLSFITTAVNVPAIYNGGNGRLTAINGFFAGSSSGAGLVNQGGRLFARNIKTTGYQGGAVSSTGAPSAATLDEFAAGGSQGMWYTPRHSMNMDVKYPPFPPWGDTTKWVDLIRFRGGGLGSPTKSDTTTLRMALTSGRPNIELDRTPAIPDTFFVQGGIERIVCTSGGGGIRCPAVVIRDNTPPVVTLQFMVGMFINRSSKTVILESCNGNLWCEGTGDVFVNGFMGGRIIVRNPAQRVWVRDFNGEGTRIVSKSRLRTPLIRNGYC